MRHTRLTALTLTALIGCSPGVQRYPISGTVSYKGQPVQAGSIAIEPDASIGPVAPTCYARIEKGQFQLSRSEGPVAGKYWFRVTGFDLSKIKMDGPRGVPVEMVELFPRHELIVNIPPPNGSLAIEVPEASTK